MKDRVKNALIVFLFGWFIFSSAALLSGAITTRDVSNSLNLITMSMQKIVDNYVEEPDMKNLTYGAIRGMLESLNDPYSVFFTPDEIKEFSVSMSGEFGGIGIRVSKKDDYIVVVAPIEGTPGYRAGLKPGDKIVAIDDENAVGISLEEAVKRMRGKPGTKVKLTILRGDEKFDVTIIRQIIEINPLSWKLLSGGILYLKLREFSQKAAPKIREAIKEAKRKNRGKPFSGVILDLRYNPGGLLSQAVAVANIFLKKGIIVSAKGRKSPERVFRASPSRALLPDVPMVVLVNQGSASASEIVSGALKDNKRALLVGTRTFGKGVVQAMFDLPDGSAIKLTVEKYYTPSGVCIQGIGIEPHIYSPEPDIPQEEKEVIENLTSSGLVRDFYKKHPHYTYDDLLKFHKELKNKGYDISFKWLKYLVEREEALAQGKWDVIDVTIDPQLQDAINILKSYNLFSKVLKH